MKTWITKIVHREVFLLVMTLIFSNNVRCADLVVQNPNGYPMWITIRGEIKEGDEKQFAGLLGSQGWVNVQLDSSGGDPETAMKIGALIRHVDGWVSAKKCYSSCVLIFAGGVYRSGHPEKGPIVGVHRLYFSRLKSGLTGEQVKLLYETTLKHIRAYLAEMNVAPEFVSFMQSFEPSEIHILSQRELTTYGLGKNDPLYEERYIAGRADAMGISSLELRSRIAAVGRLCNGNWRGYSEYLECEGVNLYGISIAQFQRRHAELSQQCPLQSCMKLDKAHIGPSNKMARCEESFMATGKAINCD
jgi:hypothetical protein